MAIAATACTAPIESPGEKVSSSSSLETSHGAVGSMGLFARLDAEAGAEENVFFSPASLEQAFGLLHAGAAGETREQIENFFGWPAGEAADRALAEQRETILNQDTPADIRLANALWLSREYRFGNSYRSFVKSSSDAKIDTLDFRPGLPSQASARIINQWASDATEGLISDIVTPEQLADTTAALLTNALYFNANWKTEFLRGPKIKPFLFGNGEERPFHFMHETDNFVTANESGWEAVRLPYVGERFAMDIVMPERRRVEAKAPDIAILSELDRKLTEGEPEFLDLQVPRFEVDFESSVKSQLQSLGLALPFAREADLSGMTDGEDNNLFVSDAYQITKLQVYEQGTKAAAVTVLRIIPTAGRFTPNEPRDFHVDRPFTVVMRDLESGAVLFVGRIADPQAFEPEKAEDSQ